MRALSFKYQAAELRGERIRSPTLKTAPQTRPRVESGHFYALHELMEALGMYFRNVGPERDLGE